MDNRLSKISFNDYKPLRDAIFDSLREAIIMGELKPGERLMEIQLADKLGVSRTPVREAIRKLELEELVTMIPRKGAHVAELSLKDIMNVLEIRGSLDALATKLASQRMNKTDLKDLNLILNQFEQFMQKGNMQGLIDKDVEFHELIYRVAKNEKLIHIASNLKDQIHRFRVVYLKDFSSPRELVKEHRDIINALQNKDEEMAEKLAEVHIRNQQMAMTAYFAEKS